MFTIDDAPADIRHLRHGESIGLGDGRLEIRAPAGWSLVRGVVLEPSPPDEMPPLLAVTTEFGDDEVLCTVHVAPYTGTPDELLDELVGVPDADVPTPAEHGSRRPIRTCDGTVGRMTVFGDAAEQGVAAAFVVALGSARRSGSTVGVEVVAVGSSESIEERSRLIADMLSSMRVRRSC